jgi:4-hydroxybenzoate polyprenyltransferase
VYFYENNSCRFTGSSVLRVADKEHRCEARILDGGEIAHREAHQPRVFARIAIQSSVSYLKGYSAGSVLDVICAAVVREFETSLNLRRETSLNSSQKLKPLVVNVNGTLVRGDTLMEALLVTLLRRSATLWTLALALLRGRSALKKTLADLAVYDPKTVPLRQEVLEFLKSEKQRGRELHVATGADQSIADCVAERTGLFISAEGSQQGMNLRGRSKLERLRQRFPEGFAYTVNDTRDSLVWQDASSIVLVGASGRTRRLTQRMGFSIEREIPDQKTNVRHWLKAIRIHQWAKNLLLFVPLFLAHRYTQFESFVQVLLGFVGLGLVASGTYLINDLSDLDADRVHDTKRNRPVARSDIGPGSAFAAALTLLAAGLCIGVYQNHSFAALLLVYAAVSLSYSLHFKKVPIFDVFLLACLYTLRILMGTLLVAVDVSPWLLVFSLFFFLSLSIAKRHVEIVRAGQRGSEKSLIAGRGYNASDAPLTIALGVTSSMSAILILFLYIVNDAYPIGAYGHPQWLWLIGIIVFLWALRIWFLSHRALLDDDPVAFALRDPISWLLGVLALGVFVAAIL